MDTNDPGPVTDESFHDDPRETEKDNEDLLVGAMTFEDLMKVVGPHGRWAIIVVFVCAVGKNARCHSVLCCLYLTSEY